MDPLSISAASGMRARIESLDLLANNLANASTSGFKADREFYSLFLSPEASGDTPTTAPVIEKNWTDFAQGPLSMTGNPLDLAINGRGFFVLQTKQGNAYTRNGSFRLSKDGMLVSTDGNPLLDANGKPLRVDPARDIEILGDGTLRQQGQTIGQVGIVQIAALPELLKESATTFRWNGSPSSPAAASNGTTIEQGKLESPNFNPAEAAVRLVSVMRQFEMLQRALALGADMNRKAIDEVARVA